MFKKQLKKTLNLLLRPSGIQIARFDEIKESAKHENKTSQFYVPSPTCQIDELANLYEIFFNQSTSGVFVEIGAYDGESFSNTSCLADIGWRGHYIEPVPDFFQKCQSRHAKNTNTKIFNLAIGAEKSEIDIFVGGPLSTVSTNILANYKNLSWSSQRFTNQVLVKTNQITLDDFLDANGIAPKFDLLIVDVEGHESDVFKGFNLQKYQPKMLIVELSETHPDFQGFRRENAKLFENICSHDYYVVYKDAINTVFVSKSHHKKIFGNLI